MKRGSGAHVAWVIGLSWEPEAGSGKKSVMRAGLLAGMGEVEEAELECAEMAIGRLCRELSPGLRSAARPSRSVGFDAGWAEEGLGSRHSFFVMGVRAPAGEAEARAALGRAMEAAREKLRALTRREPMSLSEAMCDDLRGDANLKATLASCVERVMAQRQREELDLATRLADRRQGAQGQAAPSAGAKGL